MKKAHYPHKVAAIYPGAAEAKAAVTALTDAKIGDIEIVQLTPGTEDPDIGIEPEADATRDTAVRDTLAGAATGTVVGAAAAGATALVATSLFVSAPVVATLMALGYGTLLGGIAGAIRGLRLREGMLAGVIKDALKAGHHVVVVHVANDAIRDQVDDVLSTTLSEETAHS